MKADSWERAARTFTQEMGWFLRESGVEMKNDETRHLRRIVDDFIANIRDAVRDEITEGR